ncbi:MAG TPA: DUF2911 domain-containing protein [Lacunisphaera sp.]|jgi:hypothetical protein|nr:DUF2911 domain-containing protein [Lacunisphaera sp.]
MTPRLHPVVSVIAALVCATGLFAQAPAVLVLPNASPAGTVKQRVGITDIEINYSRPGKKGREIFGNLVPYDKVWRTGANTATEISFSTPVKLNGTAVPAGTYELFTIPGKTEWTVIIHKHMSQWGAYSYDEKNDVARFKATPVVNPYTVETFTIGTGDLRDTSGTLYFVWDRTRVPIKVEVDTVGMLRPQIEAVMASDDPKKPYVPAAMFYLDNNIDLPKAIRWMDAAIAAQPDAFYLVYRKALIQAKAGDKAGAIATATASKEAAAKDPNPALRDEYIHLNDTLIESLK